MVISESDFGTGFSCNRMENIEKLAGYMKQNYFINTLVQSKTTCKERKQIVCVRYQKVRFFPAPTFSLSRQLNTMIFMVYIRS